MAMFMDPKKFNPLTILENWTVSAVVMERSFIQSPFEWP
jgi:hypothetical protein